MINKNQKPHHFFDTFFRLSVYIRFQRFFPLNLAHLGASPEDSSFGKAPAPFAVSCFIEFATYCLHKA